VYTLRVARLEVPSVDNLVLDVRQPPNIHVPTADRHRSLNLSRRAPNAHRRHQPNNLFMPVDIVGALQFDARESPKDLI
jgi:hypothetical protein